MKALKGFDGEVAVICGACESDRTSYTSECVITMSRNQTNASPGWRGVWSENCLYIVASREENRNVYTCCRRRGRVHCPDRAADGCGSC